MPRNSNRLESDRDSFKPLPNVGVLDQEQISPGIGRILVCAIATAPSISDFKQPKLILNASFTDPERPIERHL